MSIREDSVQELAEEQCLRLFDAELPADEDYLRCYRSGVRAFIKWCILTARYAGWLQDAIGYAGARGWALPVKLQEAEFLNLENPQSGLCRFIRRAVAAGQLSGSEQWLEHANWKGV